MGSSVKLGAVDAGSNAIRVVIAELAPTELVRVEAERSPVRLGHNAFTHGGLDALTIDQAVAAFVHFRQRFDHHCVSLYRAVATSAVRNATNRGKALGFNGIFGTFGLALGPLIAGALTDLISWRAAFIVPGATCAAVGIALFALWRMGYVADTHVDIRPTPAPTRSHAVRAFFVLSLTMLCVGVIGQTLTLYMWATTIRTSYR